MEREFTESKCSTDGTLVQRSVLVVAIALMLVAGGAALGAGAHSTSASASTPKVVYYVAMGDSLAAGVGANLTTNGYVDQVYRHELARYPGLRLVNLSCSGATTQSVIGGGGCSYSTGSQLGDAESFLQAHPGQVAFLTMDIGTNDVDGCIQKSGIDASCIQGGVGHVSTELPEILGGLAGSYAGLVIYGMDYYDPYLASWLTGPDGRALAQQSETQTVEFNALLGQIYHAAGIAMADPATLFKTTDLAPTGAYLGTRVPQNVSVICSWTLMCSEHNIHPDDGGHAALALSVEQVIDHVAVTTTELPPASVGVAYGAPLNAVGGIPAYRWSLATKSDPLPPGLHLEGSGTITGVPRSRGSYALTVQVVDQQATTTTTPPTTRSASESLSLTVR